MNGNRKIIMRLVLPSVVLLCFFLASTSAKSINARQADRALQGWLKNNKKTFGKILKQRIKQTLTFTDANNTPLYHVVYLKPSGFAIVAADDRIEPIIAITDDGEFDPSPDNILGALVTADLSKRVSILKNTPSFPLKTAKKFSNSALKAKAKWEGLFSQSESTGTLFEAGTVIGAGAGTGTITDIRVAQLVQSKWGLTTTTCDANCYNYYTFENSPAGCVAVAMAQLMRYYQYPTDPVGTSSFVISENNNPNTVPLLGDPNGQGGPYNWTDMELVPGCSATLAQRQAIGALCHDAGISVNMHYTSGLSSTDTLLAAYALKNTFGYSNAIQGRRIDGNDIGLPLIEMLNPNLDAGYPALIGITGASVGHAAVVDGYGYDNFSTMYHHLNMGRTNIENNIWYNLPIIDPYGYSYNKIYKCVYNIFVSGTGEIISGRVLDGAGNPIIGALVTANQGAYSDTTNSKGIYALTKVPSNTAFILTVSKLGYNFDPQFITTGTSIDNHGTSGNRWGIDFTGTVGYTSDLNSDGNTNSNDFTIFASNWMNTNCAESNNCSGVDSEPDGDVDTNDLTEFFTTWLGGNQPTIIEAQRTFYSIAAEDGRIWDMNDTGNGYGSNSTGFLRLGDFYLDASTYGYRDILSFDISSLPDICTITSARLEIAYDANAVGINPFTWAGICNIDIANPYFGSTSNIENMDWNAAFDSTSIAAFPDPCGSGHMVSTQINPTGLNYISIKGKTQFRIHFTVSTNSDSNSDYIELFAGEETDPNKKPKLIITYETSDTPEFESIAADDGRVYAKDFNALLAGTGFNSIDTTPYALRLGDFENSGNLYSQRTVVSFDTSTLPDNCTILSAKLQMTKSVTNGNDPFNWGGNCYIDVSSPSLGATGSLENSDWQAVPDANSIAEFSYLAAPADDKPMISTGFNAAGLNAISKIAKTQLKIYFSIPYLANGTVDALNFYSGEYIDTVKRPKLTIKYSIN